MIKNIEKALENYKKELREYLLRSHRLKKEYAKLKNIKPDEVSPLRHFIDEDYDYVKEASAELETMEKVLGLSKKEIQNINKEIKKELKIA